MPRIFFIFAILLSSTVLIWKIFPQLTTSINSRTLTLASTTSFSYTFDHTEILQESESPEKSTSPYWWLNSGGEMLLSNGRGSTLLGDTQSSSKWRLLYQKTNPRDTDDGLHPQNIFRLLTRHKWKNSEQSIDINIKKIYKSASENRNESNGVFLLGRYQNADNLYYAGLRVDGNIAIKKKKNALYTILAVQPYFSSAQSYDRINRPNFLPINTWMGIKMQIYTTPNGVEIVLFLDKNNTNEWKEVLRVQDNNDPILGAGSGGVRADFMDFEFDNFQVQGIDKDTNL